MPLRTMARRVDEGSTLAELTRIVTDEAARIFETDSAAIELLSGDGRPRCSADSCDWIDSEELAAYGRSAYRRDPLLARLFETHAPAAGRDGRRPWTLIAPIVGGGALAGALRLFRRRRYPCSVVADVWVVAAHLSATMARLGVGGAPFPQLTVRQAQVAELAGAGYSNREIAAALGFTVHAVKKHLGHLFERLHVSNRTELAALVARRGGGLDDGASHRIRIMPFAHP
jgi:DNA-binding CsgD family transcriptional regulator